MLQKKEPDGIEQKKEFLKESHIAVWDVIESCDITGSSDSSIRNAKFNDLDQILRSADIKAIYANGKKAEQLYRKHILPLTGRDIIGLPSTSPANAAFTMERLIQGWKQILEKIECH